MSVTPAAAAYPCPVCTAPHHVTDCPHWEPSLTRPCEVCGALVEGTPVMMPNPHGGRLLAITVVAHETTHVDGVPLVLCGGCRDAVRTRRG